MNKLLIAKEITLEKNTNTATMLQ